MVNISTIYAAVILTALAIYVLGDVLRITQKSIANLLKKKKKPG